MVEDDEERGGVCCDFCVACEEAFHVCFDGGVGE